MSWVSKVPAWVLPLVQEYAVPDDATVQVGVDFDSFDGGDGDSVSTVQNFTSVYPGIVPSYSLEPIVQPTTGGLNYILKAKKSVGFYAIKTEVVDYDSKRINSWEFPLERKNFGYVSIGRGDYVMFDGRIAYSKQIHLSLPATLMLLNYDDQFDSSNLLNSADKLTATRMDARLSPTVKVRFTPLPTWEVWALRWFQEDS